MQTKHITDTGTETESYKYWRWEIMFVVRTVCFLTCTPPNPLIPLRLLLTDVEHTDSSRLLYQIGFSGYR
jgi:hypothetical protein